MYQQLLERVCTSKTSLFFFLFSLLNQAQTRDGSAKDALALAAAVFESFCLAMVWLVDQGLDWGPRAEKMVPSREAYPAQSSMAHTSN